MGHSDNGVAEGEEKTGLVEEVEILAEEGAGTETAVEGAENDDQEVPPLARRDDSSSDSSLLCDEERPSAQATNTAQSIHIDGVPPAKRDESFTDERITRVHLDDNSSVDSRASIRQLFDDKTIDTNNLVTPVRILHGDVKQQTNSFDQVLSILLEMKEINRTKDDLKAQKREIMDEDHKDLTQATETVRLLGEENKNWMQQQNEKINET